MRWTLTAAIVFIVLVAFMAFISEYFLSGTVFRMPS